MNPRVYPLSLLLWSALAVPGQAAPKALVAHKPSSPVWKSASALLSQLDVPVTVGKYQLRLPEGYKLQSRPGPNGAQVLGWVGAPRANGVRPYLMLSMVDVLAAEAKKQSGEQILDKFLQSIQRKRGKDWKRTPTEHGTINGLPFVRARWSGSVPESPFKLHGFNYVALVKGQVIQLSSQDVEPVHRAPLELAEAAALTFKVAPR